MYWPLVGVAAALLTMFAFIPQIIKSLKSKSVKDVSLMTLIQFAVGVALWMIYGIYRKDPILIYANLFSLLSVTVLIFMYFNYGKEKA